MGANTQIQWTDHTHNIAWGCTKYSAGCKFCYADTFSHRYGFDVWGPSAQRRTFGQKHWNEPLKWNKKAEAADVPAKVFCSSMCDIFEDHPTIDAEREKLWPLIRATPWLIWQLLTKRADRILPNLPPDWGPGYPNVWLGVSTENQEAADERIPRLLDVPARVRFVSAEPLLGPIDFELGDRGELGTTYNALTGMFSGNDDGPGPKLDWVIVGGESGPSARPMDPEWVRSILDQCKLAGTAFFFKQWGEWCPEGDLPVPYPDKPHWSFHSFGDHGAFRMGKNKSGRLLDGVEYSEFPT